MKSANYFQCLNYKKLLCLLKKNNNVYDNYYLFEENEIELIKDDTLLINNITDYFYLKDGEIFTNITNKKYKYIKEISPIDIYDTIFNVKWADNDDYFKNLNMNLSENIKKILNIDLYNNFKGITFHSRFEDENSYHVVDNWHSYISLNDELLNNKDLYIHTFLHEMTHCYLFSTHKKSVTWLEEAICVYVSNILFELLYGKREYLKIFEINRLHENYYKALRIFRNIFENKTFEEEVKILREVAFNVKYNYSLSMLNSFLDKNEISFLLKNTKDM